jgi:hypothetical protein
LYFKIFFFKIYFGEGPITINFDMIKILKIIFGCSQIAHGHNYFFIHLIDKLGVHMLPVEYCTIVKYGVIISLFYIDW